MAKQSAVEVKPQFKAGDVVTTRAAVPCKVVGQDKNDGWADPGWEWRITEVFVDERTVRYHVRAHKAFSMYWQVLKANQIAKKVGEYKP